MIETKMQGFIKDLAVVKGVGGWGGGVGFVMKGGIGACLILYKYT